MPRGGSKPGERRGGRKKGEPNKASIKREAEIKEAVEARGHKLAKDIMGELLNDALGQFSAMHKSDKSYAETRQAVFDMASDLAPYQSPRMQNIAFREDPFDLSKLTDAELAQLEKLRRAATDPSRNPGGTSPAPNPKR